MCIEYVVSLEEAKRLESGGEAEINDFAFVKDYVLRYGGRFYVLRSEGFYELLPQTVLEAEGVIKKCLGGK